MRKIRVLIVDDSITMRTMLKHLLQRDPEVEVVGEAWDAFRARTLIKELNPDVVTLDVEMPGMDGLAFLEKIMRLRPTPVIMVSTLTHSGSRAAVEALRIGAVGCFGKPLVQDVRTQLAAEGDRLIALVKQAACARVRPYGSAPAAVRPVEDFVWNGRLLAIGASTGGVEALFELLQSFPANCPPTLIVQHMPPGFTSSLAQRLDRYVAPQVVEAEHRMPVEQGRVYIAPGGRHMQIRGSSRGQIILDDGAQVSGHKPSVDMLFTSVARFAGPDAVGVILTGMGRDGAEGLGAMRAAGAATFGQDEASCVVYGMPRAARAAGAVERELPLEQIGPAAIDACRASTPSQAVRGEMAGVQPPTSARN